jgi:hypothetical protein
MVPATKYKPNTEESNKRVIIQAAGLPHEHIPMNLRMVPATESDHLPLLSASRLGVP